MEINVRNESRIVEIWLTRAERQDAGLRVQLKPLCREYQAKKYLVAVFESGADNVWDSTAAMLRDNRRYFARQEAECQREMASRGIYEDGINAGGGHG